MHVKGMNTSHSVDHSISQIGQQTLSDRLAALTVCKSRSHCNMDNSTIFLKFIKLILRVNIFAFTCSHRDFHMSKTAASQNRMTQCLRTMQLHSITPHLFAHQIMHYVRFVLVRNFVHVLVSVCVCVCVCAPPRAHPCVYVYMRAHMC